MSKANPVARAIQKAGSRKALAQALSVTRQAVERWLETGKLPPHHVLDVEKLTGISRHELRPDIFGRAA